MPRDTTATAAARTGLTVSEYLDRINAGLLWCWRDQDWEPAENFGVDRSRVSGRATSCRRSKNAAARAAHIWQDPKPRGKRFVEARDGDKAQARRRVNYLVESGLIPRPGDLPCTDCGHVGTGPRHEYDHHLGYAPEHHEDVEPVCAPCHHLREIACG